MSALHLSERDEKRLLDYIHHTAKREEGSLPTPLLRQSLFQLGAMLYRSYFDLPLPLTWEMPGIYDPNIYSTKKDASHVVKIVASHTEA